MDVHMCSPTLGARAMPTPKRPRSPPSPSSYERPAKRMSLQVNHAASTPYFLSAPPLQTRQVSEESWVARTRGLRIDFDRGSPGDELEVSYESGVAEDTLMNLDTDEHPLNQGPGPCPPPNSPMQSFASMANDPPAQPLLSSALQDPTMPSSFSSQMFSPPALFPSSDTPHFASVPATTFSQASPTFPPSATFMQQSPDLDAPPEPITPPSSTQDLPAFTPMSPSTNRKQRFTMGPRADCTQCRLRIPGHSVHVVD